MRTIDTNRVNMVNAVITYCDADTAATSGIPAFATAMTALKAKMTVINGYNQIGNGDTSGVTQATNALREAMIDIAFKCARATLAYANATGNVELKALVNYSYSDLEELKREDVDDTCQEIHDATNDNAAAVANYGVTATDITDLASAIQVYRSASGNPRAAVVQRSQAKKEVIRLVREVLDDSLAGQMDIMVDTLKNSNRLFWDGYKQAREIIDLGSTSAKVRGVVTSEADGLPLVNVRVTVYETGTTNVVKQEVTDGEGKYSTGPLNTGDYDFKWELTGYETVSENNVHISPGKEVKRDIEMIAGSGSTFADSGTVNSGMLAFINPGFTLDSNTPVVLKNNGTTTLQYYFEATVNAYPSPSTPVTTVAPGQTINTTAGLVGYVPTREKLHVTTPGPGNGVWAVEIG